MAYHKVKKVLSLGQKERVKDVLKKIINQYIIQNYIGGGMKCEVYLGYDLLNKRNVAIKVLNNIQIAEQEAHVMKLYGKSKFLADFYDFFIKGDKAYIVMEYVRGQAFGGNFDSKGRKKDKKLSIEITINILKGLISLHDKTGFHHGDIRPKNVMIYKNHPQTIKIIDFNCSKKIDNVELVSKDIRDAARMCIYLINGTVPEPIHEVKIDDKKLKSILFRALNITTEDGYRSHQEFRN